MVVSQVIIMMVIISIMVVTIISISVMVTIIGISFMVYLHDGLMTTGDLVQIINMVIVVP